jgi:hypothetical protein
MPDSSSKSQAIRRYGAVFSILGLIGLFFLLNYFLFIPRQQAVYNQKVFRLLNEAVENFKARVQNNVAYKNKNKAQKDGQAIISDNDHPLYLRDNSSREDFIHSFSGIQKEWTKEDTNAARSGTVVFKYDTVFIKVTDASEKDSSIAISRLLPALNELHNNVFDLLILIKRVKKEIPDEKKGSRMVIVDSLLYKTGTIASGNILPGDSLFQNNRAPLQFSSINEVTMEGASYKAFSLPFQIGQNDLMLSGFIAEDVYHSSSAHYSYSAFLSLGSLLVLILLILPFLKVFLLSRKERVSVNDVRMLIVVLVGAPFLGLLAAFTLQYYTYVDGKTDKELDMLEASVTHRFREEIQSAIRQLECYDSLFDSSAYARRYGQFDSIARYGGSDRVKPKMDGTSVQVNTVDTSSDNKASTQKPPLPASGLADATDLKHLIFYPDIYKNLDDIFWVDSLGNQIMKWFLLKKKFAYLQISDREFFKAFSNRQAWPYPIGSERSDTRRSFFLQPTVSYATNEYSVNIALNSNRDFSTKKYKDRKAILVAMAARMYSVCNPVLPKGFNFCIFDVNGNILYHSETVRSLQENLFDETNGNFDLRSAVTRRESVLIPSLYLYDHDVKMQVSPMDGMPYFFAGFFNKREQNLFVFHISAFTFLCVSITLISLLVFLLLNYLIHFRSTELNFRIHESAWMRPSFDKRAFYRQVMSFELILTVMVLLLLLVSAHKLDFSLQAALLLPLFVATGYYIVKTEFQHQLAKQGGKPVKKGNFIIRNSPVVLTYLFFMAFAFFIFYQFMYTQESKPSLWHILFMLFLGAAVPLLAFAGTKLENIWRSMGDDYMHLYTMAILFSIGLISILPTISILNYATVEEKRAQIKGRQFHLAQQIESRRNMLNADLMNARLILPGLDPASARSYMQQRKLSDTFGIYLPEGTSIRLARHLPDMQTQPLFPDHNHFYKSITHFLFLPKDHADFFSNNPYRYWRYENGKDSVSLLYRNMNDPVTPEHVILTTDMHQYAGIGSVFFKNYLGIFILITLLILVFCYYHLIRSITKKIFLLDYFVGQEHEAETNWLRKYFKQVDEKLLQRHFPMGIELPLTNKIIREKETEYHLTTQEGAERVLRIQYILLPQYKAIWKDLDEEERFILHDFAIDGFTNHKNVDVLYGLYQKGLIRKGQQHLEPMNYSFRNYLLGKSGTEEISLLRQQLHVTSNWGTIKMVFYGLFLAVMVFLFTTQEEVSNKIIAIVSGMVTIIPLLLRLFDKNLYTAPSGKTERE